MDFGFWIWILDLDFGWIWAGFGLDLAGFGSIRFGFWSVIALIALHSSLGGPRKLLGKVTKVTKATRVIKCIIEHKNDHLAS